MKKNITVLLLAVAGIHSACFASLRIVTYNTAQGARSDIDTVLQAIGEEYTNGISRPIDVLLLQEQLSVSTTTQQIVNIMNSLYGSGMYNRGIVDGETTGAGRPGIVYNTGTVELLEEVQINEPADDGAARSTMRYKLRPVGYNSPEAVFYAYVSHLKASNTGSDASRRGIEAQEIRNDADALGDGVHVIYAGDLNLYTSSEQAWQNLTASGNGQAFDPVNRVGDWNNNSAFTDVHTQSPVTSEHFSGQITGGMDDRFDFQLSTGEFQDSEGLSYIPGSYHAFGNNNTHGLNNDISNGTGASAAVLNALENSSDHIPVVADYQIPAKLSAALVSVPDQVDLNASVYIEVIVANDAEVDTVNGADELDYRLTCTGAVLGTYTGTDAALGGANTHLIRLDTTIPGDQTGQINITGTSQGVQPAAVTLDVSFRVIDSGADVTEEFGWEEYVYAGDPQAVLGTEGTLSASVCLMQAKSGQNSLRISQQDIADGAAYIALVYDLQEGDEITASVYTKDPTGSGSDVVLGAWYLSDSADLNSTTTVAGFAQSQAAAEWTNLQNNWTFDTNGGQNQALLIYVCAAAEALFDDVSVSYPIHGDILSPEATSVNCSESPEYDLNQDCIVNLLDFVQFAQYWLDGIEGEVSTGGSDSVIITGVLDGTLAGNTPKAVELYVNGTVDLSDYTIRQLLNGSSWESPVSLSGVFSDTFVYLIRSNSDGENYFDAIFGTDEDFANRVQIADYLYCDGGNDAFQILREGVVIDQVYTNSTTAVYNDSYLYRNDQTGPDGANWLAANWTIPGNNTLRFKTAEQIRALVPFGTYRLDSDCTLHSELDLSGDCQVNLADILIFLEEWMACNLQPEWACLE